MKDNLKQVTVRMSPRLHAAAIKEANKQKISFGEFVRQSVNERLVMFRLFPFVRTMKPRKGSRQERWERKGRITR